MADKKTSDGDDKAATFKKGDKVEWDSRNGEVHGTVEKKLTEPTKIKSHEVKASKDNPEYLVKSDKNRGRGRPQTGRVAQSVTPRTRATPVR